MGGLVDEAFQLLCDWLEGEPGDLLPDGVHYSGQAEVYHHLLDLGAVSLGPEVNHIECPGCLDHALAGLVFIDPGYRGYCLDCGWIDLAPTEARSYQLDPGRMARWLQVAFGLAGRYTLQPLIPDVLWRLGEWEQKRTRYTVFFARRWQDAAHVQAVNQHLLQHSAPTKGIVLSASRCLDADALSARPRLISLRAAAHLRKGGLQLENIADFLGPPKPSPGDVPETSLRLLRTGRLALIAGESIKVPPQIQQFLLFLLEAQGQPVTKRDLADWLEMSVDECKGSKVFKRYLSVYQTFVEHDVAGRYWLKAAYCLPVDQY